MTDNDLSIEDLEEVEVVVLIKSGGEKLSFPLLPSIEEEHAVDVIDNNLDIEDLAMKVQPAPTPMPAASENSSGDKTREYRCTWVRWKC